MTLPAIFRPGAVTRWNEPADIFDRMMQRMFQDMPAEMTGDGYPVDISEEDDHILVDAELPGFKKDEINVSINDDLLSIEAERSSETPKGRSHLQERRYNRVQRMFRLPSTVDTGSIEAKLEGGVLHMEMKKAENAHTRKIEVK
ncbi:MAG: Hsp20/alpha crystallin family protein [Pirellulales bacterium]|nr:Hsp20/alpha crystallin family protein [Pirellulales bacterium]